VSRAEVAELADALGSGPSTRKGVGVRVPSSAPVIKLNLLKSLICKQAREGSSFIPRHQSFKIKYLHHLSSILLLNAGFWWHRLQIAETARNHRSTLFKSLTPHPTKEEADAPRTRLVRASSCSVNLRFSRNDQLGDSVVSECGQVSSVILLQSG
jgi:hypothetical protein